MGLVPLWVFYWSPHERPIIILKEKPLPSPGWPHRLLFSIIKGTRCGPPQSWFRLRSADICLGSALGSTWFHLVPRPAHGGFAWGVREFALVPPLVPLGSMRFHDTKLGVSRGNAHICFESALGSTWFRPVPRHVPGSFIQQGRGISLGSGVGSTWPQPVSL